MRHSILQTLIAVLIMAIVIIWVYTVKGRYDQKTEMYDNVLNIGVKCKDRNGTYDYTTMQCIGAYDVQGK